MNKNRLEAFSDGVLAIIITIMVLEIKIPHGSEWNSLKELIPVFISYAISFAFIGIYWGNHHHLLHAAKSISSAMILANLNLLFWLSLIPFATGWMGENNFSANPMCFYGIILLLCGISYVILQKIVEKHVPDIDELRQAFKTVNKKGIATTILLASALPSAFIHPYISGAMYILVTLIWFVPDKNIEKALREANKKKS